MLSVGQPAPAFEAQPIFGLPVRVPPTRPLALFFVHQLASPITRELIAGLQAMDADFDLAGVDRAVIVDSALEAARDFVPRHHVLTRLVADPDHRLFELYQVGGQGSFGGRLRAIATAGVLGAGRAFRFGVGWPERRQLRLPAVFVVAPGGTLAWNHLGKTVTDLPPLGTVLEAGRACS